jgi:hypothetical protein
LNEFYNELDFLPKPEEAINQNTCYENGFCQSKPQTTRTQVLDNLTLPKTDNVSEANTTLQTQLVQNFSKENESISGLIETIENKGGYCFFLFWTTFATC